MKTIIERMCCVCEKMQTPKSKGKMPMENMANAMTDIKPLMKLLGMNANQVVILTALVQKSSRYRIDGNDIAEYLDIEYLKFLTFHKEMDDLRKRGYIRINKDGDIVIPKEVISCLKENKCVTPEVNEGLDTAGILTRIRKVLSLREDDQCSTIEASHEISTILNLNPETSISKACHKHIEYLSLWEKLLFYVLVYEYYYDDNDNVYWRNVDDYFTDDEYDDLMGDYRAEMLELQISGIITYCTEDGLMTKDCFKIKDEIKEEVLEDVGGLKKRTAGNITASRKMEASSIKKKDLFYNPSERTQIDRLKDLLSPERFDSVRETMSEKGLRTGFTCLFYGGPGTGKTESVYQIARESGRDLFIIDVSQIKSCWVGESEKNIKDVFNNYRSRVKSGGTIPILLFNEADAIFGIRQTGAERAVDKMENSIQNIILQEMEDLDGILMATTNLTENLDNAFERRFLYKVRFDKPSTEAKRAIWKSMIGELSDTETGELAKEYDFSGGQIENICRKKMVSSIINGSEPTFGQIKEFCDEEMIGERHSRKAIGF